MSVSLKKSFALAAVLGVGLLPVAAQAATGGILDSIQQSYQSATATWMAEALTYARHLFGGLAVLEIAWAGGQYVLRRNDLPDFVASVFLKVVSIAFFYTFLIEAPTWIPDLIGSFAQAGQQIGGAGVGAALTPSGIFALGEHVAATLLGVLSQAAPGVVQTVTSGGAALGAFLLAAIVIGLSAFLVLIGFAIVAVQLLVTLIESYIVIGGGVLMLGFAGSRWTMPFAERYLGYAVSVGIKLFVLYLIVGLGGDIARQLTTQIASYGAQIPPLVDLQAGVGSLIFGAIGYLVPGLAGSLMNGSPTLSLGTVGGVAAGVAGGTALTAMAGVGGAAAVANATIGAAKAAGAVGSVANRMGSGAAMSLGVRAAGGQMGDALQGIGARRATRIASQLGDRAVQGWGEGTLGGHLANRVRATALQHSVGAASGSSGPGGAPGNGIQAKGTQDSLGGSLDPGGAGQKPGSFSPSRPSATQALRRLANTHLPHDGHTGGISIRLNHPD